MLPASSTHRFSLADVMPNCLASLQGGAGSLGLPPVSHALVVLVDGLGTAALARRAGHARTLVAAQTKASTIGAGFPTTTASAIATLATGVRPGQHGLVGYSVLDAAHDRVVNQLSGWDGRMDPISWQRVPTVFEGARDAGIPAYAVGPARYSDSGFSQAVLRGAEYLGAASIEDRFARARSVLASSPTALLYLYVPELDVIAHRSGVESGEWTAALEELDAAVARIAPALGPRHGMLVTADHGVLDIPHDDHILIDPELLRGVRHVAGEPRALQLHLEAGVDGNEIAAAWRAALGRSAWIATRQEAIEADWFGEVDPVVAPRIGDVLVAARSRTALYVDSTDSGRRMVGQHGSLSAEETAIPLLRFGAYRR